MIFRRSDWEDVAVFWCCDQRSQHNAQINQSHNRIRAISLVKIMTRGLLVNECPNPALWKKSVDLGLVQTIAN